MTNRPLSILKTTCRFLPSARRLSVAAGLALAFVVQAAPASAQPPRSLLAEYERLQAAGCQPEQFDVATPIEARVLRNVPFARAGLRLTSIDLIELYASDGDWYRPEHDRVELGEADATCVARLRRHEMTLREQLPLGGDVELVLTRDLGVFWSLRQHTRYPNAYRDARGTLRDGQWTWGFVDGAACGGDGSPEAAEDCAGFTVICTANEDAAKPVCELVMAG